MRFMVIVPASRESEAGVLPDTKILAERGKFNEEMVKAGVMLAAEACIRARRARASRSQAERRR